MKLKTENNTFMSFEYQSLFGLIRISSEGIFVFSIHLKKNDKSLDNFIKFLNQSKKTVYFLEVKNWETELFLLENGFRNQSKPITINQMKFRNILKK